MNSRLLSVLRKETREILRDPTAASRGYAREFVDSGYFDLVANVKEYDQVSNMLDRGAELHVLDFGQPHHLALYRARRLV